MCDLPGSLKEPIDELIQPIDKIILLASWDAQNATYNWVEFVNTHDVSLVGTFVTFLGSDIDADWSGTCGQLRDLDRNAVNEAYLDALPDDTQTVIQFIANQLKVQARTE